MSHARPIFATLVLMLTVLAGCSSSPDSGGGPASTAEPTGTSVGEGIRVVAVGDISCDEEEPVTATTCQQQATADLTASLRPHTVIALGDLQYEAGTLESFETSWAEGWGQFDEILAPVPGNHEYNTDSAAGYEEYFDAEPYSVHEIAGWRVYLLDSNCEAVSCTEESTWLSEDLRDHPTACTAVAMHHPRWSSGAHGPQGLVQPLWDASVDGGVDLSLAGHDHDYERFARLDTTGHPTSGSEGTRQFVVGTGGKSFYGLREPRTGSQFIQNEHFGVLELTLRDDGYDWRFLDTDDRVLDSGSDTCSPSP